MDQMATGSVISPPTRMVRRQPKKREPSSAAATGTSPSTTGTPQRLLDTMSAGQAPAMAPSLADAKRLKHREYVKRSYNKKIVRRAHGMGFAFTEGGTEAGDETLTL